MATLRRIALIWLAAGLGTARADGLDGERFVPSVGAEGTFVDEHPAGPPHLGWSAGLFFNYADDQIVLRDTAGNVASPPLHTGLTADVTASLGLFGWSELGIGLPLHLVYDGDLYAAGAARLDAAARVGDLPLVPKVALLPPGTPRRHVLLGLALPISLPTGDDEAARGAGGVTIHPELLFAFHADRIGLGLDAGYRYRAQHPADLPWGDEVTLAPWLSVALTRALTLRVESFAAKQVGARVAGADFPFELLAGVDYAVGDWDLYAAASRGITDGIGDPAIRIIAGVRYHHDGPRHEGFEDSDHDGILDKDDKCRDEPEDEDGFQDEDGCPDPDNDEDGVPDEEDECPELKGDRAHDGCPATTYVKIEHGKVYIFGKVQFSSNSARIDHRSDPLLHHIAEALNANPGIGGILIEGHPDNVGDARSNQRLSEGRAAAVREALIQRGVNADRLRPRGFGEPRPTAPNKPPAGRTKNRRVDFVIQGGH